MNVCAYMCIHFRQCIYYNQDYQVGSFLQHVLFQAGHVSASFTHSEYYLLVIYSIGLYQITHEAKS